MVVAPLVAGAMIAAACGGSDDADDEPSDEPAPAEEDGGDEPEPEPDDGGDEPEPEPDDSGDGDGDGDAMEDDDGDAMDDDGDGDAMDDDAMAMDIQRGATTERTRLMVSPISEVPVGPLVGESMSPVTRVQVHRNMFTNARHRIAVS